MERVDDDLHVQGDGLFFQGDGEEIKKEEEIEKEEESDKEEEIDKEIEGATAVVPLATRPEEDASSLERSAEHRIPNPRVCLPSPGPPTPQMFSKVKLINPITLEIVDGVLEFLTDNYGYTIIGCLGFQGSGKSTILSKLADSEEQSSVFPANKMPELNVNGTEGLDIFVTKNRIIYIDTEPLMSSALLNNQSNLQNMVTEEEHIQTMQDLDVLNFQMAALLMSVCHVILVVEGPSIDPKIVRYLISGEILTSLTRREEDNHEKILPHIVMVHNEAQAHQFTPLFVQTVQEVYSSLFEQSLLPISSGVGIATGTVLDYLTPESCGEPINLFFLPHYSVDSISYETALYHMKWQILSLPRYPLSTKIFSERDWWNYTKFAWKALRESPVFDNYKMLLNRYGN